MTRATRTVLRARPQEFRRGIWGGKSAAKRNEGRITKTERGQKENRNRKCVKKKRTWERKNGKFGTTGRIQRGGNSTQSRKKAHPQRATKKSKGGKKITKKDKSAKGRIDAGGPGGSRMSRWAGGQGKKDPKNIGRSSESRRKSPRVLLKRGRERQDRGQLWFREKKKGPEPKRTENSKASGERSTRTTGKALHGGDSGRVTSGKNGGKDKKKWREQVEKSGGGQGKYGPL